MNKYLTFAFFILCSLGAQGKSVVKPAVNSDLGPLDRMREGIADGDKVPLPPPPPSVPLGPFESSSSVSKLPEKSFESGSKQSTGEAITSIAESESTTEDYYGTSRRPNRPGGSETGLPFFVPNRIADVLQIINGVESAFLDTVNLLTRGLNTAAKGFLTIYPGK